MDNVVKRTTKDLINIAQKSAVNTKQYIQTQW